MIERWLDEIGFKGAIEPLNADASFRNYFRLRTFDNNCYIIMDASNQKETLNPFISIQERFIHSGVGVAEVLERDLDRGFLLIEDLGNLHLADIGKDEIDDYYAKAIDTIVQMQVVETEGLPPYDETFLRFEMGLMQEWYLEKYRGISLDTHSAQALQQVIATVTREVLVQPQGVFVHRDFHSRNIMITDADEIAVIDFQDARVGSVTYDLVSLLRDVYVGLEPEVVIRLALSFRDKRGLDVEDAAFLRWFDFMGMQRHIKILGIFARLHLRDGKDGYLNDIPMTLNYLLDVAERYEETQPLCDILRMMKEK